MTTEMDFLSQIQAFAPTEYVATRFPLLHVDKEGDCLEVIHSDEPYNGERIDGRITLYRGVESGDIVGVLIKGLSTWINRVLKNFPGMVLDLNEGGRFKLELFFEIEQFETGDVKLAMCYKKLKLEAEKWTVDIKELGIVPHIEMTQQCELTR